jgi:DNA-directed RNA polymerase subunit E'/Rpb7
MFYLVHLKRQVDVEPKMFGPHLEDSIKQKVITEVFSSHLIFMLGIEIGQ